MNKKGLVILFALLIAIPVFAGISKANLEITLSDLRRNLKREYQQMSLTRNKLSQNYEEQHAKMVSIMKQCNELSLRLYSQKQEFTFDISYTLENVKNEFNAFEKDKMPYDHIVGNLDLEIERYGRLIEALRRLPPELDSIHGLADSLLYHNDSIEHSHLLNSSQLELTIEAASLADSVSLPFTLDSIGQQNRDTCIYYAKELLKMYFESKAIVVTDSIHYHETFLLLKESYDYSRKYYKLLQHRIFLEGQTPWPVILSNYNKYWEEAKRDMKEKYAYQEFVSYNENERAIDSLVKLTASSDTIPSETTMVDAPNSALGKDPSIAENTKRFEYSLQIIFILLLTLRFLFFWLVVRLLLIPVFKFVKPVKNWVSKEQKPYVALLVATVVTVFFNAGTEHTNFIFDKAEDLSNTFIWLLSAIVMALIIRLDSKEFKYGIRLYRPTIYAAFLVIGCRVLFIPNSMMNIIFPPFLILFFCWQLLTCLRHSKKADQRDKVFSWISVSTTGIAMILAIIGFIFASLMLLVWWYFQMAAILTMITIWHLIVNYKEKRMNPRISDYLNNITMVTGQNKKTYLFSVTWFYDLVKEVLLPIMVMTSIPYCLHLSLGVFDFDDLYENIFYHPFIQLTNDEGIDTFSVSLRSLLLLASLFFVFRYVNIALHSIWQQSRYSRFLKKTHRKTINKDEINLTLGNSIITIAVWMIYIFIVVLTLNIPTGSMSLIAGGFSAGIGLALKDILNNFIYGIQLMSGRLKVGDWIECDGVRGKVTDINYQTTQVETINNTSVSFLNSSLFAKSFTNLTKSNSYEFLKILVGVSYGTDVQRVREILEEAMKVMCTKDDFGRDIVDPRHGVYVRFGEFGDSSVEIAVKQYILASERIPYVDKAKEVIYNALNKNGITIPFPQRDIHIITEEKNIEEKNTEA